jgi:glyoxylase-like metal-dependent hydrolase (beta-lactamase superfamily II)
MELLPGEAQSKLPLLVLHTHRHLDHRAGDPQFAHLANVQVVPAFLEDVRKYFDFKDWPEGLAQLDLGGRVVDVMPVPGHNTAHIAFYDRNTQLFLSGDFFLPGRLLVEDIDAYVASAQRVADFIRDKPVTHVLGTHIEFDKAGEPFEWESTYHPDERPLEMTKDQLLALPGELRGFNGFYTWHGSVIMMNSMHILAAIGVTVLVVLGALIWLLVRWLRRRRRAARALA